MRQNATNVKIIIYICTVKILIKILLSVCVLISPIIASAQCALCSANVQSNLNTGGSVGKSINFGILYLLSFPYIILLGFAIYSFREVIGYHYRTLLIRWRMFVASF
jgi:hypothetical protein